MSKIKDIRQEPRDRLFFDQYQYRMQFYLRYAWCMRSFDHADLDRRLENYYGRYRGGGVGIGTNAPSLADNQQRGDLHDMCDLLRSLPKSCKIMIQYDHVFLYTNELTTLEYMSWFMRLDIITTIRTLRKKSWSYSRNTLRWKLKHYTKCLRL